MSETTTAALEMRGISKEFPGVKALTHVSFEVKKGEIHALCGENGAGKSTLMKILAGVHSYPHYQGEILVQGKVRKFHNTTESSDAGIAIIFQELSLIQEMSITENIFLGREIKNFFGLIDQAEMAKRTRELLSRVGLKASPFQKVKYLGIGEQQLVEIAKALSHDPQILVLDEPTSALSKEEVERLLDILRNLKRAGVACILISHKLDEVLSVSDRVTVLRDGKSITSRPRAITTEQMIISDMVGRELKDLYPLSQRRIGEKLFEVRDLSIRDPKTPKGFLLKNVNFEVRKSEILGIAGLMGSGRTELLMALFGAMPNPVDGRIFLDGRRVNISSPYDAIRAGMALVSEDRKRYGLVLDDSVRVNMTLSALSKSQELSSFGFVKTPEEIQTSLDFKKTLRVKTSSLDTRVRTLSGGNQQKIVLAKMLMTNPKILFLDEPTRGIDVGAKSEIYQLMDEMVSRGMSIVMVSSELPEVIGMSDRILVMNHGEVAGEFNRGETNPHEISERIMAAATQSEQKRAIAI